MLAASTDDRSFAQRLYEGLVGVETMLLDKVYSRPAWRPASPCDAGRRATRPAGRGLLDLPEDIFSLMPFEFDTLVRLQVLARRPKQQPQQTAAEQAASPFRLRNPQSAWDSCASPDRRRPAKVGLPRLCHRRPRGLLQSWPRRQVF